jgi:LmbE family N-acetylglucosaminyl deacetylase
MNVVFVLAHQDDEIAFASRIRYVLERGDRVNLVCLTDGASASAATIRDEESRAALARLGAGALIVAQQERIPDGVLPEHLDRALAFLEGMAGHADEIVTLAWEGGHQDHDAAFLVAAAFARKRGLRCIEMPLYNGEHTPGPFFRVMHPVGDGWTARRIRWRERISDILLTRFYRSQRKSWLGLAPLMLLGRARELTRVADLSRAAAPPHRGSLLYERRFHYPYARFAGHAARFLQRQAIPG